MFSPKLRSSKKNDLYPRDWWYFFKPIRVRYVQDVRKSFTKPVDAPEAWKPSSISRVSDTATICQGGNAKNETAAYNTAQRCGNQPNVWPKAENVSKVVTKPFQTLKQKGPSVQSNSKAKRVQPSRVETPKTSSQPATSPQISSQASGRTKKKLTWADDLENSRGTGIKRSDARFVLNDGTKSKDSHNTGPPKHGTVIIIKDNERKKNLQNPGIRKSDSAVIINDSIGSENGQGIRIQKSTARMIVLDDIESIGGLSDSDSSTIDATPAAAFSRNKNSSSVTAKRYHPIVTDFDFEDVWSDTSSAIDINVGPVRFSFDDNVNNGARKLATKQGLRASHLTSINSVPDPAGHISSTGNKRGVEDNSSTNDIHATLRSTMPTPQRQTDQATTQGDHDDEQIQASLIDRNTELSFTTADLRKAKHSDYRPDYVRAIGRNDASLPVPRRRQPDLQSPGAALELQDDQVERAIQAAESNAKRNRGPLLDNASLKPAKGTVVFFIPSAGIHGETRSRGTRRKFKDTKSRLVFLQAPFSER
ncbi:hypothetical protein G7Y79_00027g060250 [Physcia stellaris]|nr:hypothetical protein G7Y79_00027g060250 [Physcia stellaris]